MDRQIHNDSIYLATVKSTMSIVVILLSHAGGSRDMSRVTSCVCDRLCGGVCVCTVKGKWLELPTPNLHTVHGRLSAKSTVRVTELSNAVLVYI